MDKIYTYEQLQGMGYDVIQINQILKAQKNNKDLSTITLQTSSKELRDLNEKNKMPIQKLATDESELLSKIAKDNYFIGTHSPQYKKFFKNRFVKSIYPVNYNSDTIILLKALKRIQSWNDRLMIESMKYNSIYRQIKIKQDMVLINELIYKVTMSELNINDYIDINHLLVQLPWLF